MTPIVGATALPAGTGVALASGRRRPVKDLAPGTTLEGDAALTSVAELPPGAVAEAVILAAGAIAPEAPSASLILSPLQWIAFGDRLAPVGALVNGTSIQRLPSAPPTWFTLVADRPSVLMAAGVSLPLPGPHGLAPRFRPLAAGPEIQALRASLLPPSPPPMRLLLGARAIPAVFDADRVEATIPAADGAPMTVLRLVSPPGRPRGTFDLRRFGVAILRVELDGAAVSLDDPGFGDGFYPVEHHDNAAWRWTNGNATLALPPADTPRTLAIQIATWHTQLEPA